MAIHKMHMTHMKFIYSKVVNYKLGWIVQLKS